MKYFKIEGFTGELFNCDKLQASLSPNSCSVRWLKANKNYQGDDNLSVCVNCPIGAMHSGININKIRVILNICSRCQKETKRLVKHKLCVSCANRQYEYIKGRNRHGHFPHNHPILSPRELKGRVNGTPQVWRIDLTANQTEAIIEVIKSSPCNIELCLNVKLVECGVK